MTEKFVAGWYRCKERDGSTAILWCRAVPAGAPRPFIIGARRQADCDELATAAFAVTLAEFERDLFVERIAVEPASAGGGDE